MIKVFAALMLCLCNNLFAGTLSLEWDNDSFTDFGVDRYYTNGLRFVYSVDKSLGNSGFRPLRWATNYGIVIGQEMYTPAYTGIPWRQEKDRPYAGWLYGGMFFYRQKRDTLQRYEINIGVIGSRSYVESVQKWAHRATGSLRPEGWEHQLTHEIGAQLDYKEYKRIFLYSNRFDAIAEFGLQAGNIKVGTSYGIMTRLGWDVLNDFGLRESKLRSNDYSMFVFVKPKINVVFWNIFLDGNTDGGGHSVAKERFVLQNVVGIRFEWNGKRFGYEHTFQTKEFKNQRYVHSYGTFILSSTF